MGWWDEIKGLGTNIYTNASNVVSNMKTYSIQAYAGDRWGDVKDVGTNLYHNTSVMNVVSGVSGYSYNTVKGLFEQVAVVPKFAHSLVFHPGTRMVAGHVLRTAIEDLLPLVLVTYTNDMIQRHGRDYLEDEPNQAYLSIDTAIMTGLSLLQMATWAYSVRKKMQMTVRTTVLTIEAGRALNGANNVPKMPLCHDEKCSTLRFIQGSIRDTAAFFATEAAISLIGYIPLAGGFVAAALSIHHRGRYVMTIVLPDLCNRHQVEYLMEHSELAFSLGLQHALLSKLAVSGIEHFTTIPAVWYEAAINQFMMFTTMSVAAHMTMPSAVNRSLRKLPDPVAAYQASIGFAMDAVMLGLKKKIPPLLKQPPSDIDWKKMGDMVLDVWRHPLARRIEVILVPRMLRSKQAFTNDPVIKPNWDGLRETSIMAIESIEAVKGHLFVKIGILNPNISATGLWLIFGMPHSVIELCLKLLGNEQFMLQVGNLRRKLDAMDGKGESELTFKKPSFEVRDVRSLNKPFVDVTKNITATETKVDVQAVIQAKRKSVEPGELFKPKERKLLNTVESNNGFFSNRERVFRPQNTQVIHEEHATADSNKELEQNKRNIFS